MSSPAHDIQKILTTEMDSSIALTLGQTLFIGREPSKPANCVTIFDTPGGSPQLSPNILEDYEYMAIQIRVRSTDYTTGWNLIQQIQLLLHGRASYESSGFVYTVIYCSSGPAMLDWDGNNNVRFIINFKLQRRRS